MRGIATPKKFNGRSVFTNASLSLFFLSYRNLQKLKDVSSYINFILLFSVTLFILQVNLSLKWTIYIQESQIMRGILNKLISIVVICFGKYNKFFLLLSNCTIVLRVGQSADL